MTTIIDNLRKRIKTIQTATGEFVRELQITKKEAEQLGDIKLIDNTRLIIEGNVDTTKTDCFAYHKEVGKPCYGLNELVCKKGRCSFYKPETEEINIVNIQKDIIKYEKYRNSKGVSLR